MNVCLGIQPELAHPFVQRVYTHAVRDFAEIIVARKRERLRQIYVRVGGMVAIAPAARRALLLHNGLAVFINGIEVIIAAVAMVVDYFVNAHHALANARNAGQRLKYRAGRIARGNGLVAQRGSVRRSFAEKVFALFLCKALHEPIRII